MMDNEPQLKQKVFNLPTKMASDTSHIGHEASQDNMRFTKSNIS